MSLAFSCETLYNYIIKYSGIFKKGDRSINMITAGVIAEFNPFHNGHKYLIDTIKNNYADAVIAVMSGSFVQRGGPAVTDKWSRAAAALDAGADLVLELPVVWSMNTAQRFARGAVGILDACGVADIIAFGSETADKESIEKAARLAAFEPPEVSERIKRLMSGGISHPAARKTAFSEAGCDVPELPNDILGVEYVRAICETRSTLGFEPIKRIGTGHDSPEVSGDIASASELRRRLAAGESADAFTSMKELHVYDASRLDVSIIGKLRECKEEYLSEINDVGEGLQNRFMRAAAECDTVDALCATVKAKRYTMSRIRRIAWSALLGLTRELCEREPSYIRVLGMNRTGAALLKRMKGKAELPVIVKAADYREADPVFAANVRAEDWFSLCAPLPELRRGGRDITVSPVIRFEKN